MNAPPSDSDCTRWPDQDCLWIGQRGGMMPDRSHQRHTHIA